MSLQKAVPNEGRSTKTPNLSTHKFVSAKREQVFFFGSAFVQSAK